MAYSHSFSADFYGDAYNAERHRRPNNLADAIMPMRKRDYERLCHRKFGGYAAGVEDIMAMAIETDTVSNLDSPVEVWIDPDGDFRVPVYDEDYKED